MTFTGLIGKIFMFPLQLIIRACVALHIHPNILTFLGLLVNAVGPHAVRLVCHLDVDRAGCERAADIVHASLATK